MLNKGMILLTGPSIEICQNSYHFKSSKNCKSSSQFFLDHKRYLKFFEKSVDFKNAFLPNYSFLQYKSACTCFLNGHRIGSGQRNG